MSWTRARRRLGWRGPVGAALLAAALAGPAAGADPTQPTDADPAAETVTSDPSQIDGGDPLFYDPWERTNRAVFRFNESLNRTVAEPVSRAWRITVPEFARKGMRNFFVNIGFPIRVLNTTLQLKPVATLQETFRFAVNSTFGLAGVLDPATHGWNVPIHREDFGQTLGYWGLPEGPYLVLPFFGPSSVRDTVGLAADVTTGAMTFSLIGVSVPLFATFAAQAGNFINSYSFVVDEVASERANALDFYSSVRSTYLQYRRARVEDYDGDVEEEEEEEDLFYVDEDEL